MDRYDPYTDTFLRDTQYNILGTNLAEVGTDCISRAQAIDMLRDYLVGKRCPDDGTLTCRLIENEVINKLQPIQPKRGKWIEIESFSDCRYVKCDQCKTVEVFYYGKRNTNFCPNCGADMRGRKNE